MPPGIGTGTISAKEYTAVCVAGTWTQTLSNIMAGMIVQIYVKADNATSIFDFKIKDSRDREVYFKKNITEKLNELEKHVPIAQSQGPYRLQILNSSLDTETYDVLAMVQEMR